MKKAIKKKIIKISKTKTKPKKSPPSSNTIPGMPFARDFTRSPYSDDEKRIVNWLDKITKGNSVGGGDDPIGFFMASYEMVIAERKEMKRHIAALQLDNDRLYAIATEYKDASMKPRDLAQEMYDLSNEIAREDESGC